MVKVKKISFSLIILLILLLIQLFQIQLIPNSAIDSGPPEISSISETSKVTNTDHDSHQQSLEGFRGSVLINRIIHKNEIITITEDTIWGNLTIRDDATLNVENCELEIKGMLKIKDNGRLFIKNSNLTISPGPVGPQDIIINFSNNAKVRIDNSLIFTNPQPSNTNISYLLSDDSSEVTIINSNMNCKLPAIVNMDIELTPPTAGTFILTGETNWIIQDSIIDGFLKIVNFTLLGRWFLFTLQQSASLNMKNCVGFMNDNSQPFIKPIAGQLKLEDCRIPQGVIDVEVVAEFEAINLSIVDLNIRDQTKSRIIRSTISNSCDLGSLAIIPTSTGSTTTVLEDNDDKPKATMYMEDTYIGNTYIGQGNSTSIIINSTFQRVSLLADAKIELDNCKVLTSLESKENTTVMIENTSVPNINIAERCQITIHQNPKIGDIISFTTHFNYHGKIKLRSTNILVMDVFAGDQVPPEEYGSWYQPDKNVSQVLVEMMDSKIGSLRSEDDADITLILDNSEVSEFIFKNFKNELVSINIYDLNGKYTIPEPWPELKLQIFIYYNVGFTTTVNSEPVIAKTIVENTAGKKIITSYTNDNGKIYLDLLNREYTKTGIILAGEYSVQFNYLGFEERVVLDPQINEERAVQWKDKGTPTIDVIKVDTKYQRTERGSRIKAVITDSEVKVIANATIFYKYKKDSGWSEWKTEKMIVVDNNTFEGNLPQMPDGTEVRFYIVTYDVLGNEFKSDQQSYFISNTNLVFFVSVISFILVIIILVSLIYYKRRMKVRKYLNKPKSTIKR